MNAANRPSIFGLKQDRHKAFSLVYSRWVKSLRLALPIIALALAVVVFLVAGPKYSAEIKPIQEVEPKLTGRNELASPRFESQDKDAQPYTVTATRAYQKEDDLNEIVLDAPVADMSLKDGKWVSLKADHGEYKQDSQDLRLEGSVILYHDSGYEFETEALDVNVKTQQTSSDKPVSGQGPTGTIKATGLTGDGNSGQLIFKGPAKLILNPDGDKHAPKPTPYIPQ